MQPTFDDAIKTMKEYMSLVTYPSEESCQEQYQAEVEVGSSMSINSLEEAMEYYNKNKKTFDKFKNFLNNYSDFNDQERKQSVATILNLIDICFLSPPTPENTNLCHRHLQLIVTQEMLDMPKITYTRYTLDSGKSTTEEDYALYSQVDLAMMSISAGRVNPQNLLSNQHQAATAETKEDDDASQVTPLTSDLH